MRSFEHRRTKGIVAVDLIQRYTDIAMSAVLRKASILAPPETVWAFLADERNWPRWEPDIIKLLSSDRGLVEGGSMRVRLKPGRMPATVVFRDVIAPRRLACETTVANGMMTAAAVFELVPKDNGVATEVSYTLDMGGPVGFLLRSFAPNKLAKQAKVSLDNLTQAIQAKSNALA